MPFFGFVIVPPAFSEYFINFLQLYGFGFVQNGQKATIQSLWAIEPCTEVSYLADRRQSKPSFCSTAQAHEIFSTFSAMNWRNRIWFPHSMRNDDVVKQVNMANLEVLPVTTEEVS
ncbi:hypothetical protein GPALN_014978 [Globodera pallida]|nr:hypothetical protein GPALN_014978 [Globodera pallida]